MLPASAAGQTREEHMSTSRHRTRRLLAAGLLAAVALAGAIGAAAFRGSTAAPRVNATRSRAGLSIVPMQPRAVVKLKAQGRALPALVGTTFNQGRKFNPTGPGFTPWSLDAQQKVLVLFVKTADDPPGGPSTRADLTLFDDMLFGTTYDPPAYAAYPGHLTDRTLRNYYEEATYGAVDIVTLDLPSTTGWLQAPESYGYYCRADGIHDNGFGPYPENAQGLVVEAIKAADPIVDFSQYATDGVVPNLFVVHAGTGAEWSSAPDLLWSHSWDLSDGTGMDGYTVDGVKLNNYAMMPEVGGDLTGVLGAPTGPYPATVGVYAHEYGHVLGLPDQYDYGYESNGTGYFSLMAFGSWNQWPQDEIFAGNSPSSLDAGSKYALGIVTPTVVTSPASVTLQPSVTSPSVCKMVVPGSGGKEYFLFENRQNIGFDRGLLAWRMGSDGTWITAPMHGLAIYHVDETVFTRTDFPNEAENWKEFRSTGWRKAWTGESHYGISILQADDRWDLEHGYNGGDTADLYPGRMNVTAVGNRTRPNTSSYYFWLGNEPRYGYSGITATTIREQGGLVSLRLSFAP
jgi:immune inhibitor A